MRVLHGAIGRDIEKYREARAGRDGEMEMRGESKLGKERVGRLRVLCRGGAIETDAGARTGKGDREKESRTSTESQSRRAAAEAGKESYS